MKQTIEFIEFVFPVLLFMAGIEGLLWLLEPQIIVRDWRKPTPSTIYRSRLSVLLTEYRARHGK